jgi:ubiquinol-cytochrome c reductase cytochrome b subunit
VLVIQITSGIFLTMNYKPSAQEAFASVEYIMRDVPGGWFIRYVHSTGASAFFICVYLHMARGLMYGSYRKPRELIWIFGVMIYLALMAEAFFGYLLPWGQMSYWGAQVIINLFGTIPFIGEALAIWIRGDYNVSDADAQPLLRAARDRAAAGAAGPGRAHLMALHEVGSNNPGRRRDLQRHRSESGHPARRHPVPPVLHGEGPRRRRGLPDRLLGDRVLHARDGRLLPRVQQLHPRRPAQDARAHRAGVVLHAVLRDAARGPADLRLAVPGVAVMGAATLILFVLRGSTAAR